MAEKLPMNRRWWRRADAAHNAASRYMEAPMPMRPTLRLLAATLLCVGSIAGVDASGLARLQGAWQLQSGEFVDGDGARVDYASRGLAGSKVLADGRFAFTTTSNGTFWAGGSGTYEGDGARYVETPLMASYPLEGGGRYEFRYTLEGDVWTLERWEGGRRVEREGWKCVGR